MALDASNFLYLRIEGAIEKDDRLVPYLNEIHPDFRKKLVGRLFSEDELKSISATVGHFSSSQYQELLICIRLIGGSAETASQLNIDASDINTTLYDESPERITSLLSQISESNLFPPHFFGKSRVFYNDTMVARFRRNNLTRILATATDYHRVVTTLSKELSPSEDVLLALQKGESHPRSSWACRKIEVLLGLDRGFLDKRFTVPVS